MVPLGVTLAAALGGVVALDVPAVGDASSFGSVVNRCEVFQSLWSPITWEEAREDRFRARRGVNDPEREVSTASALIVLAVPSLHAQLVINRVISCQPEQGATGERGAVRYGSFSTCGE